MAASELVPMTTNSSLLASSTLLMSLHQYKEKATDHLLLRDFEECKKTCDNGIAFAKLHTEEESARETLESLCLLCIQAFAELNSWQDVLPYVQHAYSGIEACPSSVIQLCILLHAKVKEYPKCYAIASIWLKCSDNVSKPGYADVAVIYITHMLIPQGQRYIATQFLSSCTHLDSNTREIILRDLPSQSTINKEQDTNSETSHLDEEREDTEVVNKKEKESQLMKAVKSFGVMIASKLSFINLKTIIKIAVVATCMYLVAIKANTGDLMTNLGRASVVWQGAMKVLKSMFGPYRPGR